LVVRTGFGDEAAWQRVRAAVDQPWGLGHGATAEAFREEILYVDNPAWSQSTAEDVLAAMTGSPDGADAPEDCWAVFFLADAQSMTDAEPTLLAVSTDPDESPAAFRVPASEVPHNMHCNLALGNLDFDEFSGELEFRRQQQ
jgi:hypothetical protein